jgi:Kef-type K+ transport system membrane component KefB
MTNPPNIMQPGTWALFIIVALVIAIPLAVIAVKLWLARIKWRTVLLPGLSFKVFGEVSDAAISNALLLAIEALHKVWPGAKLPTDLRIYVMDTESWLSVGGQRVGGEQEGTALRINHSMTSLCHELAHLLEARIDHVEDYAHASWASKRIWDADNEYRLALPPART